MLKKVITALIMIIGLSTITYIYANSSLLNTLKAQSAPAFQLPKGAKVVLGKYNSKEIVWDIGNNNNNGNYVLMSSKPIADSIQTYDSSLPFTVNTPPAISERDNYCIKSKDVNRELMMFCPTTPLKNELRNVLLSVLESGILTEIPFLPKFNDRSKIWKRNWENSS